MKKDDKTKPTPEMMTLISSYTGPIRKISEGKRVTRGPSKKAGQSGNWRHVEYTSDLDNEVWGR